MLAPADTRATAVDRLRVRAYEIATPTPESDGTYEWRKTTLVVVELGAGGVSGLGYTYADAATARAIQDHLAPVVEGRSCLDIDARWSEMFGRLRNVGVRGIAAMAVSAVDVALWDAKAKLLGVPLIDLFGARRDAMPIYGSGGFCSYTERQLRDEFGRWRELGLTRFKMKVGRDPAADPGRVALARSIVGEEAELFVDANSAYGRKEAARWADRFVREWGVTWLEEPRPPEDLAGLRELRQRVPPPLEIADGEYGYDLDYFRRALEAEAVDVMQADATRCGGFTGFLKVAALCEAWNRPLSCHCAPALHLHVACAAPMLRHAEYFADHVRIEHELFEGVPDPAGSALRPDRGLPGHGLAFKWQDAEGFAV